MESGDIRFLRNDAWLEWLRPEHETDARKNLQRVPAQKPYPAGAKTIDLTPPGEFKIGDTPLRELLWKRRSRREYSPEPISIEELSFLLWACQGVQKIEEQPFGSITYRTAPSASGLHPFETYLGISRVDGVNPGLYRYLAIEHKLLVLRDSPSVMDELIAANLGGDFAKDCAVYFVWTTIPARSTYTYSIAAGKIIALDAGHMCENLYLAGEATGIGVCAIGAFYQKEMDALLAVSGDDEFAVYAATVGKIP